MSDNQYPDYKKHIRNQLDDHKSIVLQGPPGTGKTHTARELIEHKGTAVQWSRTTWFQNNQDLDPEQEIAKFNDSATYESPEIDEDGVRKNFSNVDVVWDIVQLHPGYAYEDFVRGIEIETNNGASDTETNNDGVNFVSKDKIIVQLAQVARQLEDTDVILVLDEINRASLPDVLGELILALEPNEREPSNHDESTKKEGYKPRLQYDAPRGWDNDGKTLSLPENLKIIGTMNTADQSISKIDYAIRRRFRFISMPPDPKVLYEENRDMVETLDNGEVRTLTKNLLKSINEDIDDDRLKVGHSYLLLDGEEYNIQNVADEIAKKLAYDILPLLREYSRNGELNGSGDDGNEIEMSFSTDDTDKSEVLPLGSDGRTQGNLVKDYREEIKKTLNGDGD